MSERDELVRNLRGLVELDRGFGIEFSMRLAEPTPGAAPAPNPAPVPAATPVRPAPPAPAPAPVRAVAPAALASRPAPTPAAPPLAEAGAGATSLAGIAAEISACRLCGLCSTRRTTVPGEGSASPELLFVGEGPGADEDAQGRPFVGAAGQLLTKMIEAMGFQRGEVFIANVVKCRPPGNRTPEPAEVAACMPYLRRQIAALRPKVICTLGNTPLRALLGDDSLGITRQRGKRFAYEGITLIPTFHPSYLLRNAEAKKPCWEDLQSVLKELGRSAPPRR
jgi:DNA polymerase